MCTVSLLPGSTGYRLGMNRDEQRTRVKGVFPGARTVNGVRLLGPSEPSGGRWVVVNSCGVTYALLNWYDQTGQYVESPVSRGKLVESVAIDRTPNAVSERLAADMLRPFRPFRLIGVFGGLRAVMEWRWDGREREIVTHRWEVNLWASSGYDEPGAQRARRAVFEKFCRSDPKLSGALETFHCSHEPAKGALSVCMHREEAATVSYSEIRVGNGVAKGIYVSGPPCESKHRETGEIPLSSMGCTNALG